MALSFRLRRAITLSSSIIKDHLSFSSSHFSKPYSPPLITAIIFKNPRNPQNQSFSSFSRRFEGEETKIGPDDILFEGCDYNHWLITIDFPKDPRPTDEEMVETYVQTAAKVFGSVEEAKKRIYACSTTTYNGFQVVCDEATSEKFRGLPGVVFILPDSYIDVANKQYGGDKYDNGVITRRPPPIQYGRRGRYGDRNRNFDQPRYDSPQDGRSYGPSPPRDGRGYGSAPPQAGTGYGAPLQDGRSYAVPPQDGRGYRPPQQDGSGYGAPLQDGRGYRPPQQDGRGYGAPQQDGRGYGPPPQDGRGYGPLPQDGRGYGSPPQDGRGYGPPPQDGRGYGSPPQDGRGYGPPPQDGRGYGPPPQDGRGHGQGESRNYAQGSGRDGYQGGRGDQLPPYGFSQGQQGNLPPQEQRSYSQGTGGNYGPGSTPYRQPSPGYSGDYRQGSGPGYNVDNSRQEMASGYGGDYEQGPGLGSGPSSTIPVEDQGQGNK